MSSNLCLRVSHTCSNYGFPFGLNSSPKNENHDHHLQTCLAFLLWETQKKFIYECKWGPMLFWSPLIYIVWKKYIYFFKINNLMQLILLMKWKVKSSTLHYRIQYSTQYALLVHPTILQNVKGYAEKFSEKICILWLCVYDLKHNLCVWDIQNLHSPFIQSICNFTCLCIYGNDCLDMVDLEIIPKCPAF